MLECFLFQSVCVLCVIESDVICVRVFSVSMCVCMCVLCVIESDVICVRVFSVSMCVCVCVCVCQFSVLLWV